MKKPAVWVELSSRHLSASFSSKGFPSSILMATLVAAAIFWKSQAFSPAYRLLIASGVLLLCLFSSALLNRLEEYKKVLRLSMFAALIVGVAFYLSIPVAVVTPAAATLTLPDHTEVPVSRVSPVFAWGKVVNGYTLHPAFAGSRTANALTVELLPEPTFGTLLVTQPPSALRTVDGSPNGGDGISLTVKTFDEHGALSGHRVFTLSQAEFLERGWIELPLWRKAAVTRLEIMVDSGPIGSTPAHDTTLIGLQFTNLDEYFHKLSTAVLLVLSSFSVFFVSGYVLKRIQVRKTGPQRNAVVIQFVTASLLSLGFVFWQQTQSNFVYFWDYLNYWAKTEALFSKLQTQQWAAVFSEVFASLSANYSAVPAFPMAFLAWLVGSSDQVTYALILSLIYTMPTYFIVIFLAKRIMDFGEKAPDGWLFRWDISWVVLILIYPSFFGTTLFLMPDIGGVFLVVSSIMIAAGLLPVIAGERQLIGSLGDSASLIAGSLSLGALLALSFLFRRWYVFSAAGILGAILCLLLIDILMCRHQKKSIILSSAAMLMMVLFSSFSLLLWTLSSWAVEVKKHDYASLYTSYDFGLTYSAQKLIQAFGFVPILISVAGLLIGLRSKKSNDLVWVLVISTVISVTLFLGIQAPGRHHFYLLMPLLTVGFLLAFWTAIDRWGGLVASMLAGLMLVGSLSAPRVLGLPVFPEHGDLMPKQQPFGEGLKEIARWLDSPEVHDLSFCVIASSVALNQSMVANLWQIYPALDRNSFSKRLIPISEVDSTHGSPRASIKACDIFLVADPFQYHLSRSSQFNVELLQRELLTGYGVGEDVDRKPVGEWALGVGIRVVAYKRNRPTSDAHYLDLVERYREGKAFDTGDGK